MDAAHTAAAGVALEGCINETMSALELLVDVGAHQGEDRRVLAALADDELRHAQLAWRTLVWLLPQLSRKERRVIRRAMHEALPAAETEISECVDALLAA